MSQRVQHRILNVILIAAAVSMILACGGDPEDPPRGSIWVKLVGKWSCEPISLLDEEKKTVTTQIVLDIYWSSGPVVCYPSEKQIREGKSAGQSTGTSAISDFTVNGMTATSAPNNSTYPLADGSVWSFRVDPNEPGVFYATWTLKDGTKRLDEVKFTKFANWGGK